MMASGSGNPSAVRLLIARGGSVNAKNKHGYTALMVAAGGGHVDVVRALLAEGADVNAKDNNGYTALMAVAEGAWTGFRGEARNPAEGRRAREVTSSAISIIGDLLNAGADVSATNIKGGTALMLASGAYEAARVPRSWSMVIEALLPAGATPKFR